MTWVNSNLGKSAAEGRGMSGNL